MATARTRSALRCISLLLNLDILGLDQNVMSHCRQNDLLKRSALVEQHLARGTKHSRQITLSTNGQSDW